MFGTGLTKVPDEDLMGLLRALHHGRLTFPITRSMLFTMGMNQLAEHADPLLGLSEDGVRAVLVTVLAERRATVEEKRRAR